MWIKFWNAFVKITGWPVQFLCFRTKVYYQDKSVQGRRIRGPVILISNHTAVFDYAVYLFVFFSRTLRFQMAELLFEKPFLGWLLRALGGIRVDRNAFDFGFIARSQAVLGRGGVVGVFPEGRLPRPGEARPLPFKSGAAYLALSSGVPVLPVVTDGCYFKRKRAHVMIGCPISAADFTDAACTEKENLQRVTDALREEIIQLEARLHEKTH